MRRSSWNSSVKESPVLPPQQQQQPMRGGGAQRRSCFLQSMASSAAQTFRQSFASNASAQRSSYERRASLTWLFAHPEAVVRGAHVRRGRRRRKLVSAQRLAGE